MDKIIALLGFFIFCFGLAGVIYPKIIRKRDFKRKHFGLAVLAGFALFITGAAIAPKPAETRKPAEKKEVQAAEEYTFTPVQDVKPVWDMKKIAGQKQAAVEAVLDKPIDECIQGKYGLTCEYKKDGAEISITYIKNKADWIHILDSRIDNAYTSPVWLGYEPSDPTIVAPARLAWENIPGLLEFSAFITENGRLAGIHIKTQTQ